MDPGLRKTTQNGSKDHIQTITPSKVQNMVTSICTACMHACCSYTCLFFYYISIHKYTICIYVHICIYISKKKYLDIDEKYCNV